MSINSNYLVSITPRVIGAGSADLETNGLLLTNNALIPTSKPVVEFITAQSVANYFGAESKEADFANQYFSGVNNQQKSVQRLFVARRVSADCAAWIRSAPINVQLSELVKIEDGSLKITIGAETKTVSDLDLSTAKSLSEVATLLATAITGVTGVYNSDQKAIILTTTATGDTATIGYAEATGSGTDLSALLGLSEETGAVLSQGSKALTPAQNMNLITSVSRNWVGFTTLYETELEEAMELAKWADIDDDYVYFDWDNDVKMTNQATQSQTKAYKLKENNFNCLVEVYGGAQETATFLAVGASIDWTANQGIKTWFAKSASGIKASVLSDEVAEALDDLRVNYVGAFATRNAEFDFINRGCLLSGIYEFIDVLYGMIWFKARIQRQIMDGFASINRAPYNALGFAFIEAWLLDPINEAKRNGVIDTGLELSNSQVQQLLTETANTNIKQDLFSKGYWYLIESPSANVRTERGTPRLGLWFTYAGSIQRVEMPLSEIL